MVAHLSSQNATLTVRGTYRQVINTLKQLAGQDGTTKGIRAKLQQCASNMGLYAAKK